MRYEYDTITIDHPGNYRALMQRADSAGLEPVGGPFTWTWAAGHGGVHKLPSREDETIYCEIRQAIRRPLGKESE